MRVLIYTLIVFLSFACVTGGDDVDKKSITKYELAEEMFQMDADLVRLYDLKYWTGLIEKYKQKLGYYPFQKDLGKEKVISTWIATKFQKEHNKDGFKQFKNNSVSALVSELSLGLGYNVDERYDIQKIATTSPIGYHYFVTKDGYLFWVTCITCGVTPVSTLLMNGITPTVNIASIGMVDKVTKAKTRKDMLSHPIFKKWINRPFFKKQHVDKLIKENSHDSQE